MGLKENKREDHCLTNVRVLVPADIPQHSHVFAEADPGGEPDCSQGLLDGENQ